MNPNECEQCSSMPISGVLFNPSIEYSNHRYGRYVERCDYCEIYPDDRAAARVAAGRFGLSIADDDDGYFLVKPEEGGVS